jgi:hypothetical protein
MHEDWQNNIVFIMKTVFFVVVPDSAFFFSPREIARASVNNGNCIVGGGVNYICREDKRE